MKKTRAQKSSVANQASKLSRKLSSGLNDEFKLTNCSVQVERLDESSVSMPFKTNQPDATQQTKRVTRKTASDDKKKIPEATPEQIKEHPIAVQKTNKKKEVKSKKPTKAAKIACAEKIVAVETISLKPEQTRRITRETAKKLAKLPEKDEEKDVIEVKNSALKVATSTKTAKTRNRKPVDVINDKSVAEILKEHPEIKECSIIIKRDESSTDPSKVIKPAGKPKKNAQTKKTASTIKSRQDSENVEKPNPLASPKSLELPPRTTRQTKRTLENAATLPESSLDQNAHHSAQGLKEEPKVVGTRAVLKKSRGASKETKSSKDAPTKPFQKTEPDTKKTKLVAVLKTKKAEQKPVKATRSRKVKLVNSPAAAGSSAVVSPSNNGSLLKIIDAADPQNDEDPYSFKMSQKEPTVKNTKKQSKPKKRMVKAKPGNQLELLMQQQALDAVGSSCNVQHNPASYEEEREKLEKQINVPKVVRIVISDSAVPVKTAGSSKKSSEPLSSFQSPPFKSPATTIPQSYSKVWHSPLGSVTLAPSNIDGCVKPFVPGSPPIQSAYALRVARAMSKNPSSASPYRVQGNLPSTFFMGISNDGTPSVSSDSIVTRRRKNVFDDQTTDESQKSEKVNIEKTTVTQHSFLGDSNAENMEPAGFVKSSAKKSRKVLEARSPLKALAIPTMREENISSLSVLNMTVKSIVGLKQAEMVNESIDCDEVCEAASKRQDSSPVAREESESRDQFGFDELIAGKDRQAVQSTILVNAPGPSDIRERLNGMKRYLPSKHNKDRDINIFPTSPLKHMNLMNSPKKATSIRQFFTASTPLVNVPTANFNDASAIELSTCAQSDTEVEHSNIELFSDASELSNTRRKYEHRKRQPAFLGRTEASDSEDDDDTVKKKVKTKRKKLNVEETGEFKRFVHEMSDEFAEVEEYEMIVE